MAWQYLLAGITPAIKAGYLLANKPKPDDFRDKFGEETLNKMIANNQADIVNKTLLNQTTSAAKSLGSRLYQNTQHELDIAKEKGLLSSGQHAQALLSAGSDIQGKVGEQQQQALIQNTQFTAGLKANLDEQRMELGRIKDQAAKDYKAATKQWEAELVGVGMDFATVGANFAQAKFTEQRNQDFMTDLMKEYPDWGNLTREQRSDIYFKMQMHALGYSLPSSIGTPASDTQTGNLLAGKSGTYAPVENAAPDTEMSTHKENLLASTNTLSPGASDIRAQQSIAYSGSEPLIAPTPPPASPAGTQPPNAIYEKVDDSVTPAIQDAETPATPASPAEPTPVKAQLNGKFTKPLNTGEYTVGEGEVSINKKGFASVSLTYKKGNKNVTELFRVKDKNGNDIKVKVGDILILGADGYWTLKGDN